MKEKLSLALGFFDGVHLGHQAVLKNTADYGGKCGCRSAVITFVDHPCCYLYNVKPKYILTREDRRRCIRALGIDEVYELDFAEVVYMNAAEYLDFLVKEFNPCAISTGYNHTFGAQKSGGPAFLSANFNNYFEVPPVELDGEVISSTAIRTALADGELEKANAILGYNFSVSGRVVGGQRLGHQLGFPTANLIYPDELVELPFGVYAVEVIIREERFKGVANFGMRPTVGAGQSLEVHILDFNKDIYGQTLTVEFLKMLRPEQKFNSLEDLKAQITKDINRC